MVGNSCRGHAAQRDDLATVPVVGRRDGFKDPEAGGVAKAFDIFSMSERFMSNLECNEIIRLVARERLVAGQAEVGQQTAPD